MNFKQESQYRVELFTDTENAKPLKVRLTTFKIQSVP